MTQRHPRWSAYTGLEFKASPIVIVLDSVSVPPLITNEPEVPGDAVGINTVPATNVPPDILKKPKPMFPTLSPLAVNVPPLRLTVPTLPPPTTITVELMVKSPLDMFSVPAPAAVPTVRTSVFSPAVVTPTTMSDFRLVHTGRTRHADVPCGYKTPIAARDRSNNDRVAGKGQTLQTKKTDDSYQPATMQFHATSPSGLVSRACSRTVPPRIPQSLDIPHPTL